MAEKYMLCVGSGSGLNPALGNTSFLLKSGSSSLLIDCGYTVPTELMRIGRLRDITDITVTHTHADHIGGLEIMGFVKYFSPKSAGHTKPRLHLANEKFAKDLWENSLKGGMQHCSDANGNYLEANLDTYFDVNIGNVIDLPELGNPELFETKHVKNMENYGIRIGDDMYYSGDSRSLPPEGPKLFFQDCQFFEGVGDVHASYDRLKRLPPTMKEKMYLVHLGNGWEKKMPRADGFAGFAKPGDVFMF